MSMLLANHGIRRNIHVVKKITAADNEDTVVETVDIDEIENNIGNNDNIHPLTDYRESNWKTIEKALYDVTHSPSGTAGRLAYTGKNTLLGKTGTAQVVSIAQDSEYNPDELDKNLHDHALFIGYAPADDPKIAIGVIVENNKGAADLAQEFTDYFFELEQAYFEEEHS
jgi:penicillin-binding protein 2